MDEKRPVLKRTVFFDIALEIEIGIAKPLLRTQCSEETDLRTVEIIIQTQRCKCKRIGMCGSVDMQLSLLHGGIEFDRKCERFRRVGFDLGMDVRTEHDLVGFEGQKLLFIICTKFSAKEELFSKSVREYDGGTGEIMEIDKVISID